MEGDRVFLNRAERTVKRWERERGLPVHRVPGGERGGVFAYPNELTDWLKGKAGELEADDSVPANPAAGFAASHATNGLSAQHSIAPAVTLPAPAPAGRRRSVSAARVAAWLLPLSLTAALIFYFSGGRSNLPVTAIGDREPSNGGTLDLAPDSVAVLPFTNAGGDSAPTTSATESPNL